MPLHRPSSIPHPTPTPTPICHPSVALPPPSFLPLAHRDRWSLLGRSRENRRWALGHPLTRALSLPCFPPRAEPHPQSWPTSLRLLTLPRGPELSMHPLRSQKQRGGKLALPAQPWPRTESPGVRNGLEHTVWVREGELACLREAQFLKLGFLIVKCQLWQHPVRGL